MESWMKVLTDAALVHTEPVRRSVHNTGTKTDSTVVYVHLKTDSMRTWLLEIEEHWTQVLPGSTNVHAVAQFIHQNTDC